MKCMHVLQNACIGERTVFRSPCLPPSWDKAPPTFFSVMLHTLETLWPSGFQMIPIFTGHWTVGSFRESNWSHMVGHPAGEGGTLSPGPSPKFLVHFYRLFPCNKSNLFFSLKYLNVYFLAILC